MHSSLITGSIPGMAASTSDTCEFGSPPNAVAAPENSFDFELTWAWTSSPITTSQSPVAPLMSFEVEVCTFMAAPWLTDLRLRAEARWRQGLTLTLLSPLGLTGRSGNPPSPPQHAGEGEREARSIRAMTLHRINNIER